MVVGAGEVLNREKCRREESGAGEMQGERASTVATKEKGQQKPENAYFH